MKLSILIPTTPDRQPFINKLREQFKFQRGEYVVVDREGEPRGVTRHVYGNSEVIYFEDNKEHSIGHKRNVLMSLADGEYMAFIDSDDRIGDNYFAHAFTGIDQGVDACGLTGIITEDGQNPKKFVHSFRYSKYEEKDGVYLRYNNHLNVIKSDIAKQFKFPEINHGEDTDWATQIYKSGLIGSEYWDENEVIYHYDYRSKK